jgi:predicted HAD superfamily phosphohydrolase YqeG
MRSERRIINNMSDIPGWLTKLGARSLILDVEPLVADWNTDEANLVEGISDTILRLADVPCIETVLFATNSRRRLPPTFSNHEVGISYLADARKPFRTLPYRLLPRPTALVGDQLMTDGLLAHRLGFAFGHVQHGEREVPTGPRLMWLCGRLVQPLLFRPPQGGRDYPE